MSINLSIDFMLRTKSSLTLNDLIDKSGYESRSDTMNCAIVWYKTAKSVKDQGRVLISVEQDGKKWHLIDPNDEKAANFRDVGEYTTTASQESVVILRHTFNNQSPADVLTKSLYLYDMILDAKERGHQIASLDPATMRYRLMKITYPDGQKLII